MINKSCFELLFYIIHFSFLNNILKYIFGLQKSGLMMNKGRFVLLLLYTPLTSYSLLYESFIRHKLQHSK